MNSTKQFISNFPVKKFDKGQTILCQDEVPTCTYVIKKGVVKTHNITRDGDEKPISLDVAGELFPVGWTFGKLKAAQYYYSAFTDVELYCVPADEYVNFLKKTPGALFTAFEFMLNLQINYQMRVNALEQSKASSKVLHTIHFLSIRFGIDIKPNVVRINLPLTQQDLANFMGLTRETTSIELNKLQEQGVLTYNPQEYIVHTSVLNDLLDEEYDQGRISPVNSSLFD